MSNPDTQQEARQSQPNSDLWTVVGVLLRWRRFIVAVTLGAAVTSIVISLLLPKWYAAGTRLLPPESSGGSIAAAVFGDLSSAARSILGGPAGDYTRYFAILTSRSVLESVVNEFDLVSVYDLADTDTPMETAIELLQTNSKFAVDDDYDFMTITVLDRNPDRAAAMANYFALKLNEVNGRLAAASAANLRRYVQDRYEQALVARDSLLNAMQSFQEEFGIFDLAAQTEAFFSQVAALRAEALRAEIQFEALRGQLGPANARVQSYEGIVRAAERKYRAALAGSERVLPVPQDTIPAVVRQYANLELERLIQEKIIEFIAPLLEQARFDERKQVEALQVVDRAVPPKLRAKPQRKVIVLVSTVSAAILAMIFALTMNWWLLNSVDVNRKINEAISRDQGGTRDD